MNRIAMTLCLTVLLGAAAAGAQEQLINYRVKSGDTLSGIAGKYLNNPKLYKELLKYNNIKDANWIYPGDIIKIPSGDVLQKMADAKDDAAADQVAQEAKQKQNALKFTFRSKGTTGTGTNGGTDIYANSTATGSADFGNDQSPLKLKELDARLKGDPIEDQARFPAGTQPINAGSR